MAVFILVTHVAREKKALRTTSAVFFRLTQYPSITLGPAQATITLLLGAFDLHGFRSTMAMTVPVKARPIVPCRFRIQ